MYVTLLFELCLTKVLVNQINRTILFKFLFCCDSCGKGSVLMPPDGKVVFLYIKKEKM